MAAHDAIDAGLHHGSAVARKVAGQWQGVLLLGPAASGKSDLAARLIDRDSGWILVADDQVDLRAEEDAALARAPRELAGKIALAGIGIVELNHLESADIALVVRLEREPPRHVLDSATCTLCGFARPQLRLNAFEASAPIRIEYFLDRRQAPE